MPDVQEVFRMATKKIDQEPGALDRQVSRQRRRARNRQIGAIAFVAALGVVLVAFALATLPDRGPRPADSTTPVPINTTPPIGAQIVSLSGTVLRQLPGSFSDAANLQLSPNGATLAFYRNNAVETMQLDGTNVQVLTGQDPDPVGPHEGLSWSPDGSKIVYSWGGDIYVSNADGSARTRLTHAARGTGNYQPAWSSDGSTIAYWSGSNIGLDGGPPDAEIYTIAARGGAPRRLTNDNVPSIEPAWQQPSGIRIIYRKSYDQELWIMRDDGRDTGKIRPNLVNPWSPAWSPDWSSIAFLSCCADHQSIDGAPLLEVEVLDGKGKLHRLHVYVATDGNGPQWVSNDTLLINRYN